MHRLASFLFRLQFLLVCNKFILRKYTHLSTQLFVIIFLLKSFILPKLCLNADIVTADSLKTRRALKSAFCHEYVIQ